MAGSRCSMASANVRLIQDEEFERGIRADGTSTRVSGVVEEWKLLR